MVYIRFMVYMLPYSEYVTMSFKNFKWHNIMYTIDATNHNQELLGTSSAASSFFLKKILFDKHEPGASSIN
jgi:hypothetical protein